MISALIIVGFAFLVHAIAWRWDRDPQGRPCRRLHLLPILLLVPVELLVASGTLETWLLVGYGEPAWTRHTVATFYHLLALHPLVLTLFTFHYGRQFGTELQVPAVDTALNVLVAAYIPVRLTQSVWGHWFDPSNLLITFWSLPTAGFLAGAAITLHSGRDQTLLTSARVAVAILAGALVIELLLRSDLLPLDPFRADGGDSLRLAAAARHEITQLYWTIPALTLVCGFLCGSRLASALPDRVLSTTFYLEVAYLSWRLALGYFAYLLPDFGSRPPQLAFASSTALLTGLAIGLVTAHLRHRLRRNDPTARAATVAETALPRTIAEHER